MSDFWLAAYFLTLEFFLFILNFDCVRVSLTLLDFLAEVFFLVSVLLCFFWINCCSNFFYVLYFAGYIDCCCLYLHYTFFPSLCITPSMIYSFQTYPKWTSKCCLTCLFDFISNCSLDKSESWQTWSEQASCIPTCTNFYCKQVNFPTSITGVL